MTGQYTAQDIFGYEYAEQQTAWLKQGFVMPSFEPYFNPTSSVAIIGASGSGKTALRLSVLEQPKENRLIIVWQPTIIQAHDASASQLLTQDLLQVLTFGLVRALGKQAWRFYQAEPWLQDIVCSLIYTISRSISLHRSVVGRLSRGLSEDGQTLVMHLLMPTNIPDIHTNARAEQIFKDLWACIADLNYRETWIIVDGLERLEAYHEDGQYTMAVLCALLELYELPEFSFKIFVPDSFESIIRNSRIVERKRMYVTSLVWNELILEQVLESRLKLLLGQSTHLSTIAHYDTLKSYLRTQPLLPRSWLNAFRPIIQRFYDCNDQRPLTAEYIRSLMPTFRPELRMSSDRVFVNGKEIFNISPQSKQILSYLFEHRGIACAREDIYYRVIRGFSRIPLKGQPGYEAAQDWRPVIDTAISRLRSSIEPNPKQPIFLLTKRGKGITLL